MESKRKLGLFLVVGLAIRLLLIHFNVGINDDLNVHQEWGRVFEVTNANYFYFFKGWIYSFPTQPPLTSWMFHFAYEIYQFLHPAFAQMHNTIHLPPGFLVKYFYDNGYYLLLKLPAIIADLGLAVVIYEVVKNIKPKKSLMAAAFYIFNPVTIFLSGIWGQTESVIAFFGTLAFMALASKRVEVAIPLFFVSLYFKPTWGVFIPLFLFLLVLARPNIKNIILGLIISLVIFLISTMPFSGKDIIGFTRDTVLNNMLPTAKGTSRASVSAFNLHSVIYKIDTDLADDRKVVITPNAFGLIAYLFINFVTMKWLWKKDINKTNVLTAIFVIGAGSFMFMANMLERYIFIAFPAMVMLMFIDKKVVFWGIVMNVVIFLNLIWAFYRRSTVEIVSLFSAYNLLVIRALSLANVTSWVYMAYHHLHITRPLRDKI